VLEDDGGSQSGDFLKSCEIAADFRVRISEATSKQATIMLMIDVVALCLFNASPTMYYALHSDARTLSVLPVVKLIR